MTIPETIVSDGMIEKAVISEPPDNWFALRMISVGPLSKNHLPKKTTGRVAFRPDTMGGEAVRGLNSWRNRQPRIEKTHIPPEEKQRLEAVLVLTGYSPGEIFAKRNRLQTEYQENQTTPLLLEQ